MESSIFCVSTNSQKEHLKRRSFVSRPSSEDIRSKDYCDVYPGRHDLSSPVMSFRMVRNSFENFVEMRFILVISSYNNITHNDKCILYDSVAMIRRLQRKDVKTGLVWSNSNRQSEYAKAIEEIQNLAPVIQRLFQIYQLKIYQQLIEMPMKKPKPIFNSI